MRTRQASNKYASQTQLALALTAPKENLGVDSVFADVIVASNKPSLDDGVWPLEKCFHDILEVINMFPQRKT